MKKLLFIMNPFAGQKKANKVLPEVLMVFTEAGYEIQVAMTTGPGSATRLAAERGADVDLVVCCGGDGTLNETVAGLLLAGLKTPVGYIPSGTTNDFASSLKLSHNPVEAARDIVEGQPVAYDVGKFGDRYFCYVASFGAFTKTSYAMPQTVKNALGHTAYVLGGISELSQIRNEHVRMEIDGEIIEDDFLFGAICNSTSIGGIITLPPNRVDMGDGIFEVMLIRAPRNLTEVTDCLIAAQTQNYDCGMVTFRTAKSVKITVDPFMSWSLDGEKADGYREITVENLHQAIKIVKRVN
ncbi:MAG: YegS/Rv2252/BmrU family lipid kinase [Oscillospiraceae bacterium]